MFKKIKARKANKKIGKYQRTVSQEALKEMALQRTFLLLS